MSIVVARIGRDRQRYEDNLRLVSGCIPYRITNDDDCERGSLENKIEVLMVSSPNRDDMVFPKGGWEDDETVEEAACREALEEAGVRGVLNETPLGVWEFRSKSSSQDIYSVAGGCKGYMFALEVTEELKEWPEQGNRHRRWLNVKDAFELCRYEWMRRALEKFLEVIIGEDTELGVVEAVITEEQPSQQTTLSEVISERQIVSSNCCKNPTTTHQLRALLPFSWFTIDLNRISLYRKL